jgi:hypothetical protein
MCVMGVLRFVTLSVAALALGPNEREGWLPLDASVLALHENSTMTSNMLAAQASLHDSVNKLHDTGLDQTLREFRDSLTALKPVLENLKEPFILQAVPIKVNGTTL